MQRTSEALDLNPSRLDPNRMAPRAKVGQAPPPPAFAPLSQAVMESFNDGLVVLDSYSRLVYANEHARELAGRDLTAQRSDALRSRLLALGGRTTPLRQGGVTLGEVIFLPMANQPRTLADRERQAILDTLNGARGRLAETARRLGISRTTLWRRLRAYGIRPANGHGRTGLPPRS